MTQTASPFSWDSLLCSYPDFCNLSPLSLVLLDRANERNRPIDTESTLHTLFTQYRQAIGRYLTRLTGDPNRAEELDQETFVRAYLALEQGAQWQEQALKGEPEAGQGRASGVPVG